MAWLAPSADTAPQPASDLPTTLLATEAPRPAVAAEIDPSRLLSPQESAALKDGPGSTGEEDDDDEQEGSRQRRKNGPAPANSRRLPRPEAHRPQPGRGGPERAWQGQPGFRRGPPPGSQNGPHAPQLMRRLDEVMEKLSRIEAQLDASAPAHSSSHAAPQPVHGVPPEAGQRMRAEIQERMEQARRRFGEMEERIRRLEAEVERLKRGAGEPPAKL
jgi:hypothetical protein